VVNDLLDDWLSSFRPPFTGFVWLVPVATIASNQRLLARNQVPYQWMDIEADEEARRLVEYAEPDAAQLPLVLLPDGSRLIQPSNGQIAEKIGLRTRAEKPFSTI